MQELPRTIPDVRMLLVLAPEELAATILFLLKKRNDTKFHPGNLQSELWGHLRVKSAAISAAIRKRYRSWLDAVGTPIAVQQKLMRHADIRTTMNIYGDVVTNQESEAHSKIVGLALPHA